MSLKKQFQSTQKPMEEIWDESLGKDSKCFLVPDSESAKSHRHVLDIIGHKEFMPSDGHFGIGNVWFNLKLLARSRQSFGILADAYAAQIELFDKIIEEIKDAKSRQDWKNTLSSQFEDISQRWSNGYRRELFRELDDAFDDPSGTFYDDAGFQHIQNLAQENNLISLYVDLFDKNRVRDVASSLQEHNRTIGTLYLTNLPWFMQSDRAYYGAITQQDVEDFWCNIGLLCCDDKTLVCDAQYEHDEGYNEEYAVREYFHYVETGTCCERQASHFKRRAAYAAGNRSAFDASFTL